MKLRSVATIALLSLAVTVLGACGSSDPEPQENAAANEPATQSESEDQPDVEETEPAEEEEEVEEAVSACLEAPPSKTRFEVVSPEDPNGFGYFKPKKLEVPAGEEITIVYTNEDHTAHSFAVDAVDCNSGVLVDPKKTPVTFTMPSKATEFRCTLHQWMTGTLVPTV